MNRRTSIAFPVFSGYRVNVILAANVETTGRRLQVNLSGAAAGYVSGAMRGWIVLPVAPDEATVAHEAAHAVRAMLRYAGVRVDDEVFAYHLDYLVGKIHRFIKRTKCK